MGKKTKKQIAVNAPPRPEAEPLEHGPASAHYNVGLGNVPEIVCLCDERFDANSWEEVGQAFDDHLEEMR